MPFADPEQQRADQRDDQSRQRAGGSPTSGQARLKLVTPAHRHDLAGLQVKRSTNELTPQGQASQRARGDAPTEDRDFG